MNSKEYIEEAERDLLHAYNRYQIVLDRGEGVFLYDTEGKKYLDLLPELQYLHWDTATENTMTL